MTPLTRALLALILVLAAGCGDRPQHAKTDATSATARATADAKADAALAKEWQAAADEWVAAQRKIIVLLADEEKLSAAEKQAANQVAHRIFHSVQERSLRVKESLAAALARGDVALPALDALLTQIESEPDWFDADRLAVKELLLAVRGGLAKAQSLNGIKAHKRATEDLEAIAEIEQHYEREMRAIFGRFDARAIDLKRERWDAYVAKVRSKYTREAILRDYAVVLPSAAALKAAKEKGGELNGTELPAKTLLLTFDDGPHAAYTDEILAILKQFGAKAVFFQVGRNLGDVDSAGRATLGRRAEVSRRIVSDGHVLANHSFSHAQLSRETGAALSAEIAKTDMLLKAISPDRSSLFRFPYGARNDEGLSAVAAKQLRSMMWNIDSRDWADPVPTSIADRVLKAVKAEGRGIVLFHDIHERTVKALPIVLEQLRAEGYQFASWTPQGAAVTAAAAQPQSAAVPVVTAYRNSWALVIGVNQYAAWPKLAHAVQDADAIQQSLALTLGFSPQHIFSLRDGDATRSKILAAFRDLQGKVGKEDRVFIFFAGHGATRKLASGRTLGYIVPQDAAQNALESDAIAMTEVQNLAESLAARHVFFVMDACYSGLALTRGAASDRFVRDNMRRVGRQMLTAGGADQMVADSGPGGHSVFTWTLLQALGGRADTNGDGYITATEIAAFVAPAVAQISQQTPAFGSLPGSEGGEFVFARPREGEDLSTTSAQLAEDAINFNAKLATAPTQSVAKTATRVTIPGLAGEKTTLVVPVASAQEPRQLAEQANDVGLKLYREKRYGEAERAFADALKHWPDYAQAANNLGFVYYKQGRHAEAARWFEATIAKDPSRAVAYLNLGDAYVQLGEKARASKAIETYIAIAPHEAARRDGQKRLTAINSGASASQK